MSTSVTLPQLGESVTEGTITRWLKNVGDHVNADEPLVEISTDKVDTEIPSPVSGILLSQSAQEDDIVEVGAELAVIGEESEVAAPAAPAAPTAPTVPVQQTTPESVPASEPASNAEPAPAAPAAAIPAANDSETRVVLPALGESVTEGTVTRWLKAVGDSVAADEPLVEISTDKVDTEIPSPAAGILTAITAPEDAIIEVGGELGRIGSSVAAPASAPSTPAPSTPAPSAQPSPAPVAATAPATTAAPASSATPNEPTSSATQNEPAGYVTPLVRRMATEKGIDLATITGTGAGGRITKEDVLAASGAAETATAPAPDAPAPVAAAPAAPVATPPASKPAAAPVKATGPTPGTTQPMSRLRKVIAQRMVESLQVSAQLTTVIEVDVTKVAQMRKRVKDSFEQREGVKLTFMPFFVKAAVEALKQFPQVNASIDMEAGTVTYYSAENIGIAVDTERGLLVPVIQDAGDLNVPGIARRIADLAERTRSGKVSPDDLSGGTFTVTNTGSRGALFDTPIVNQPQVAILGTGAVVRRPVAVTDSNGQDVIAIRHMVYLALSYDHRLVDGADAARFLTSMKDRLEEASFDAELGG